MQLRGGRTASQRVKGSSQPPTSLPKQARKRKAPAQAAPPARKQRTQSPPNSEGVSKRVVVQEVDKTPRDFLQQLDDDEEQLNKEYKEMQR